MKIPGLEAVIGRLVVLHHIGETEVVQALDVGIPLAHGLGIVHEGAVVLGEVGVQVGEDGGVLLPLFVIEVHGGGPVVLALVALHLDSLVNGHEADSVLGVVAAPVVEQAAVGQAAVGIDAHDPGGGSLVVLAPLGEAALALIVVLPQDAFGAPGGEVGAEIGEAVVDPGAGQRDIGALGGDAAGGIRRR